MRSLLLLLALTLVAVGYEAAAEKAGLATVTGKVEKLQLGAWSQAQAGDLLAPGDRVRTSKDSLAVVLLDDCTSLRLSAQSELVIVSMTTMQLTTGRVWVNAQKGTTFELKGPNAVASVKGTSFEMTDLACKVWHGRVDCSGKPVGMGSQYAGGQVSGFDLFDPDSFQSWNIRCDNVLGAVAAQGLDAVVAANDDGGKTGALPTARPPVAITRPPAETTPAARKRADLNAAYLKKVGATLPRYTP